MNTNRFWTGGKGEFDKALRERYQAEKDELQERLNSVASEAERQEVERQIADLDEIYRKKSRSVDRSLF